MNGTPGLYQITNSENGRVYIGGSANVQDRITRHIWALRAGRHNCGEMQADYEAHPGAFIFVQTLCIEPGQPFRPLEQRRIVEALRDGRNLYNRRSAASVSVTTDAELMAAMESF